MKILKDIIIVIALIISIYTIIKLKKELTKMDGELKSFKQDQITFQTDVKTDLEASMLSIKGDIDTIQNNYIDADIALIEAVDAKLEQLVENGKRFER